MQVHVIGNRFKTDLRPYSKSSLTLTLHEWKFNLSFSGVSLLFLNSWRVSACHILFSDHSPSIQLFENSNDTQEKLRLNFHSLGVSELLEYGRYYIYRVSKKTLLKFNRLPCIINVAKQFNFYIGRKNSYLALQ